jgi:hypothetical protein
MSPVREVLVLRHDRFRFDSSSSYSILQWLTAGHCPSRFDEEAIRRFVVGALSLRDTLSTSEDII